jgi:hypothetical protein
VVPFEPDRLGVNHLKNLTMRSSQIAYQWPIVILWDLRRKTFRNQTANVESVLTRQNGA